MRFELSVRAGVPTHPRPEGPPLGLPMLKLPWNIRSPEIPRYLGWINYWSAVAAEAIGFPDPSRDAELLARARLTSASPSPAASRCSTPGLFGMGAWAPARAWSRWRGLAAGRTRREDTRRRTGRA